MHRKLTAGLVVAALMAVAACTDMDDATMGTAEDEAAIRAIATGYASAYSARDAAGLAALATEDYEAVSPEGTRISGRAAFQASLAEEMAMMPAELSITVSATTDFLRWIDATHAVAGGTWSSTGMPAGMGPERGSWMIVARKDADGTWRAMSGSSAAYMPPPAMPDTTKQ